MGGELTCRAECGRPISVVHASGALSRRTTAALRAAVHECLAYAPDALVVDLAGATAGRDAGLGSLTATVRAAVAYAGVNILLCTPSPQLREAFRQLGVAGQVAVAASLDEAMELARRAPPARRMRYHLPFGPQAGQAARELLADACQRWGTMAVYDRMATILTELVANGVLHARTELMLGISISGRRLYVAVHDRNSQLPHFGAGDEADAGSGSGLLVVDALAEAWGFAPTADGKVVWASAEVV